MSVKPKITIGMPVFNDVEFIRASIQSILDQCFEDFILILSDDGATDGSEKICAEFAKQDSRIEYVVQDQNIGISNNMMFLLDRCTTEFFMWAGDDDVYHPNFVRNLLRVLETKEDVLVAFSKYEIINEEDRTIEVRSNPNYHQHSAYLRLKELVKNPDDGFGYGVFRTAAIKGVYFPTWWWPNKKTPYNNIYPTLCFYLAKGNYYELEESMFQKRVKTEGKTNHKLIGQGNAIKETFAYTVRRFNLVTISARQIRKAGSFGLMLRIYPLLWYKWFLVSASKQFALAGSSFFKNRVKRSNLKS